MSITKVFNPRLNQYTYHIEENGQLISLTYEDGLKQSLAVLGQIRAEIADLDDADYDYEGYYKAVTDALQVIDKYSQEG